jgi:hypothetical protein
VSDPPPETPTVTIRNFCIAVTPSISWGVASFLPPPSAVTYDHPAYEGRLGVTLWHAVRDMYVAVSAGCRRACCDPPPPQHFGRAGPRQPQVRRATECRHVLHRAVGKPFVVPAGGSSSAG